MAEPGTQGQAPGRGAIMAAPVSVCHQVSTMGQRPSPTVCMPEVALVIVVISMPIVKVLAERLAQEGDFLRRHGHSAVTQSI